MEAQGYRDNQSGGSTAKNSQTKKKLQPDVLSNYEILNKECLGAMDTLSRKAVAKAKAEMKTSSFAVYSFVQKERPPTNIFVRPMLPKSFSKGDKNSPKKDAAEDKKDSSSPEKETKKPQAEATVIKVEKVDELTKVSSSDNTTPTSKEQNVKETADITATTSKEQIPTKKSLEPSKTRAIRSVVPIKFRRQSIDVMNNPLINKNIKDFTKAGMKTKILVIKPIKLKDGTQAVSSSLKFQTIKLKDSNRKLTGEDKMDQVVVVKVPNVDRNVVLSVQESIVLPTTEKQNASENDQVQNSESVESTPIPKDSEIQEQNKQDISDKTDKISAEVNLCCDEEIKKLDVNKAKSKPIVVKIDNKLSSTNGLS